MSHKSDCIEYNDDKCFSNDGLYLLSNVAVAAINNTNIKKEKDRTSLTINNNNKNMKESFSDGWDVFRFQISEEHRLKTTFNNAEEFLHHWLVELKGHQGRAGRQFSREPPYVIRYPSRNQCTSSSNIRREEGEGFGLV